MTDIEVVIKIPEVLWKKVKNGYVPFCISKYLMNGTPLPKGHGRLIDADALTIKLKAWDINANGIPNYAWKCIREMPTIIEADNGESEV